MTALTHSLPRCAPGGARLRRFLDDLGMSVILSAWAAVLISLATGNPGDLYQQLVYSVCIGVVAVVLIDGVRLGLLGDPARRPPRPAAILALAVLAAPVAHYCGLVAGGALLGQGAPGLAAYPSRLHLRMILFTLIAICATFLIIMNRERMQRIQAEHNDARTRAEAIERQAVQAQLRLLQAQIEPHMLFNTLANLQGLIAIDPARAGRMLDQLIQYLRATLGATRAESTSLADEFAAIDAYLGLMAVRMGARLSYRCTLPDALRSARLPAMLLQPLVENAIIHGLEPKVDGGEVTIEARARDGVLEILVTDSGPGLDDTRRSQGNGVGLATTRERLRVLYGERASLMLMPGADHGAAEGAGRGTVARLVLPLEHA